MPGRRPLRSGYVHSSNTGSAPGRQDGVVVVELGIEIGVVAPPVGAAALLAGERAGRHEARERVRVGAQRVEARGVALEPGVAPTGPRASRARAASTRGRAAAPARRGAGRRAARPAPRSAARRPNTKHSVSEFEASRLAPCRPVHAHSPTA